MYLCMVCSYMCTVSMLYICKTKKLTVQFLYLTTIVICNIDILLIYHYVNIYSKGTTDTQRLFSALQIYTILSTFGISWGDFLITY